MLGFEISRISRLRRGSLKRFSLVSLKRLFKCDSHNFGRSLEFESLGRKRTRGQQQFGKLLFGFQTAADPSLGQQFGTSVWEAQNPFGQKLGMRNREFIRHSLFIVKLGFVLPSWYGSFALGGAATHGAVQTSYCDV